MGLPRQDDATERSRPTGRLVLYMSMSLDGFIAGPDDRAGQELGRDGGRLFNWLDDRMSDGPSGQVFRELMATGAVISGRRTFELAGRWQGDHHDGVPIFVLTHHIDDGDVPPGSARFVTDVGDCAEQARAAGKVRAQRRRCCGPGCSTRWNSTSCRSYWAEGGACSTRLAPATSSSSWPGSWRRGMSRISGTGCVIVRAPNNSSNDVRARWF